jgi:hypothetical protein
MPLKGGLVDNSTMMELWNHTGMTMDLDTPVYPPSKFTQYAREVFSSVLTSFTTPCPKCEMGGVSLFSSSLLPLPSHFVS